MHLEVLIDKPSPLSTTVETILTSRDPREWLLDSGASKHTTPPTDRIRSDIGKVYIEDNSINSVKVL